MFVLYVEIAVILSIVFGSLAASHLEKRREKKKKKELFQQEDSKQKSVLLFGGEQFKKLISKNLTIPVTLL